MRQRTLSDEGFEKFRKPTRREKFLDEMNEVIPWSGLCEVIELFYPKGKGAGRPPIGVERMLRIHFLQHWFNLSDPAVEETLYDSRAMRRFVGIDLGREPVPDETTICKFRHFLERHNLGVDSQSKLIHSVAATPAIVHDSRMLPHLLHGNETRVWGDSAYTGQTEAIREAAPYAQHFTHKKGRRGQPLTAEQRAKNRTKSKVRAKGEHPLLVLKCIFGFRKVRYRGIAKNVNRLIVACGLVNLYMTRRLLLRPT
jgi:IS5 family transposase